MNINRYNYEEFFLLYVDGELSVSERKAVEDFVVQNPDLEEELSMLKQSLLKPDHSVMMENKSMLLRNESSPLITLENYETFFLLYVDEELNTEERRVVETFAGKHPSLQDELQLLMQTRLQADENISFPDKNILYKVPAINRTSVVRIYRIAAVAVMIILAFGIYWLIPTHTKVNAPGAMAKINSNGTTSKQETKEPTKTVKDESVTHGELIAAKEKSSVSSKERNDNTHEKKNEVESKNKIENTREFVTDAPAPQEEATIRSASIPNTTVLAVNVEGSFKFNNKTLMVN